MFGAVVFGAVMFDAVIFGTIFALRRAEYTGLCGKCKVHPLNKMLKV